MNRIGIGDFCCSNDVWNLQIGLFAWSRTDTDGFVRETNVKAFAVGSGIYGHGFDAHFFARANYAKRNFAAVGYQNFIEHDVSCWVVVDRVGHIGRDIPNDGHSRFPWFKQVLPKTKVDRIQQVCCR